MYFDKFPFRDGLSLFSFVNVLQLNLIELNLSEFDLIELNLSEFDLIKFDLIKFDLIEFDLIKFDLIEFEEAYKFKERQCRKQRWRS